MGVSFIVIGVMLGMIGISMFLPARSARKRDQVRRSWPTVNGTVISSEVKVLPPLAGKSGGKTSQYEVNVRYQFRTGGQLHFGTAISDRRYLYEKTEADRISARYPVGESVTVYHDPENVGNCFLEMHPAAGNYGISILFLAAGGLSVLVGLLAGLG
jgi:MFS superfamily sulfate permease-like transporter